MKALIVKKAYDVKEIGTIDSIVEDNSPILKKENQHRFFNNLQIINIPDDLVGKPIKSVSLPHSDYFWSKEGEADVTTEPVIPDHWVKEGEATLYEAPTIAEYWSKDGEPNAVSLPMLDERWTKSGEASKSSQPMTQEYWSKDGESDAFVQPDPITGWTNHPSVEDTSWTYEAPKPDPSWTNVPTHVDPTWSHIPSVTDSTWVFHPEIKEGDMAIVLDEEKDKVERVNKAKATRDADVYDALETTFGTKDSASANAYYETFKIMSAKPEKFHTLSMYALIATDSFAVGDTLNTETKVKNYADEMLLKAEDYAVERITRIFAYLSEKNSIENP